MLGLGLSGLVLTPTLTADANRASFNVCQPVTGSLVPELGTGAEVGPQGFPGWVHGWNPKLQAFSAYLLIRLTLQIFIYCALLDQRWNCFQHWPFYPLRSGSHDSSDAWISRFDPVKVPVPQHRFAPSAGFTGVPGTRVPVAIEDRLSRRGAPTPPASSVILD